MAGTVVRLQSPIGQKRVAFTAPDPNIQALLDEGARLFSLSIGKFARRLFYDAHFERPVMANKTYVKSDSLAAQYSITHGTLLYVNLDRNFPDDSPDSGEPLFDASKIRSLQDLPRPPRKGSSCAHDDSMRCPACYTEWENAFLKYIGKTREDFMLNTPAGGDVTTITNVASLRAKATHLQTKIQKQAKSTVRVASFSEAALGHIRTRIQEGHYIPHFHAILYGTFAHVSENDKLTANLQIEWIYMPAQQDIAGAILLADDAYSRSTNTTADRIAAAFGLRRLGVMVSADPSRRFIFSATEVGAAAQAISKLELSGDDGAKYYTLLHCVMDAKAQTVVFDTFTISRQLVGLTKNNLILPPQPTDRPNFLRFREKQLINNAFEELLDTDCFIVPCGMAQHKSIVSTLACGITSWDFPPPGGVAPPCLSDVAVHLAKAKQNRSRRSEVYADPNFLLYLNDLLGADAVSAILNNLSSKAPDASFERFDKQLSEIVSLQ